MGEAMHEEAGGTHTVALVKDEEVGGSIRRRRTALGLTVKALAEKAGVDRGRLAAIEDGASARSSTIGAIQAVLTRLEEEMGAGEEGAGGDLFEFEVIDVDGVRIIVKGPVRDADLLKRQVVDLIREIRREADE